MAGYEVGTLRASVVPDARGFHKKLRAELRKGDDFEVKVNPDLTSFKSDLVAGLTKATAGVSIEIPVVAETGKFAAEVTKIRSSVDKPMKIDVDADVAGAAAELKKLQADRSTTVEAEADTAKAEAKLSLLERARKVEIHADVDRGLTGLNKLGSASAGALGSLVRLSTTAGLLTAAVGASVPLVGALATGLVTVGAAAGTAASMLAPASITAAATAMGALKVGMSGFGEALKNMDDPAKFAEAVGKLSPNAQAAATALRDLKPAWEDLRSSVQDRLFDGVAESIGMMSGLLPQLKSALGEAAGGASLAAQNFALFASSGSGVGIVSTLLAESGRSASFLFQALGSIGQAFTILGAAAAPILSSMAGGMAAQAQAWADNLQRMYETGALQEKLAQSMETLKTFWDGLTTTLSQVGGIISGVFKAAADGAGFAFGPVQQLLTGVNQWVNSFTGQTALTSFFQSVSGLVGAVLPVLGQFAGIIGTQIAPMLSTFVQTIAPYVQQFLQSFSDALTILAPLLPGIADLIGAILSTFGDWLPVLATIVTVLLPPLVDFLEFISPVLPVLIPLLWGVVKVFTAWEIITKAMAAAQWLFNIAMAANPIVLIAVAVVAAITAIVLGIIWLWNNCEDFRNAVKDIWTAIVDFFKWAWDMLTGIVQLLVIEIKAGFQRLMDAFNWLVEKVKAAWNWVSDKFREGMDAIKRAVDGGIPGIIDLFMSLPKKLADVFSGAGNWLYEHGKNIVQGLINGVKDLAPKIGSFFLDKVPGWIKEPFKKALGIHSPSRVFFEYGGFIGEGLQGGLEAQMPSVEAMAGKLASVADVGAVDNLSAVKAPATQAAPAPAVTAPTAGAATDAASGMEAIGQAMQATKSAVIDPVLSGVASGMAAMGSAVAGTANSVVNPAWSGIASSAGSMGASVAGVVNGVIAPVMGAMRGSVTSTAATVSTQANGVIAPVWSQMGNTVRAIQAGPIETAFRETRNSVQYTASTFGPAARNIAVQWDQVRPATAAPVRYAITSVFNDGLVGMWNSVSDLLGTKKMGAYPVRFATGGYVSGPGGPTDDKVPALLSNGEYVVKADAVNKVGVHNLNALNSGKVAVANTAYKQDLPKLMATDATFNSIASRYAAGGIVEGSPAWQQLKRGWDWARSLSGRPYVLGGDPVGGGGTDCSGYMSSIADRIQGGAGHRQWATMAFNGGGNSQYPSGPQGFVKGLGAGFSIGVTNGGAAGGHTAGTLGGVPGMPATNVESGGSPSRVKFGTGAVGADDSYFRTHYHLPIVDGKFVSGGGGSGPSMQELVAQAMEPFKKKVKAAVGAYRGSGGVIDAVPGSVASKIQGAIEAKVNKLAEDLGGGPIPGGSGAERWRPMIKRAYAKQGYQWSQAKEDAWVRQIQSESGGDPNIAQKIVDVNGTGEAAGVGLGQMIPSTWAAYRDPSLPDNRRDPWAMINAMVRYGERKYGAGLLNVIGHGHGYDMGGWLDPGQGMTYNGFRKPEAVLTPSESEAFVGIARKFLDGADGSQYVGQKVENQWIVDPHEITWQTQKGVQRAMRGAGV